MGPHSAALYVFLPLKPILCISNSPRGCLHSDVSHKTGATDWVGLNVNISPFED